MQDKAPELSGSAPADKKSSMDVFFDKTAGVLKKVMSPERATELLAAQIMMALEINHDMSLYPAKYALRPEQVSPLPTDPIMYKLVDNIGDIWEISAGHTAMRLGFVALNEALKSAPAKELQKKLLQNDGVKKVAGKLMGGGDRVKELAEGADIQIPDTACFWASLMTTLTVKAVHSLGYISLFGIHDHMDAPVPGMLFGQGVAAIVLATSHYAMKNRESFKNLAVGIVEGVQSKGPEALENFKIHALNWAERVGEQGGKAVNNIQEKVKAHLDSLSAVGDYIEMESAITKLMVDDWIERQNERITNIGQGKIDGEG